MSTAGVVPPPLDFSNHNDLEVFGCWSQVMRELEARGLIWSTKSPLGDYAELLVARYFGVEPIRGTNPGFDLLTDGSRIQVKSRRYGPSSEPSHFGEFSDFDGEHFDQLAMVLFEEDFSVRCAYLAPYSWVARVGTVVKGKHRVRIAAMLRDSSELQRLELDQE